MPFSRRLGPAAAKPGEAIVTFDDPSFAEQSPVRVQPPEAQGIIRQQEKLDCKPCHMKPKLFPMKRKAGEPREAVTMEAMVGGKSCGACHDGKTNVNGKVVFSVADEESCVRCHKKIVNSSSAAIRKPLIEACVSLETRRPLCQESFLTSLGVTTSAPPYRASAKKSVTGRPKPQVFQQQPDPPTYQDRIHEPGELAQRPTSARPREITAVTASTAVPAGSHEGCVGGRARSLGERTRHPSRGRARGNPNNGRSKGRSRQEIVPTVARFLPVTTRIP